MIKHKEDCLSISGQQSINLEKGSIEFKKYFKQLPVPFKIYADFESNLKNVECYEGTYTKKSIMSMFLLVLLTKLFVLIIDLVSQLLFIEVKMLLMNLLKQYLKNVSIAKK